MTVPVFDPTTDYSFATPAVPVPIDRLQTGITLRVGGVDTEHVALLADAAEELPPIVVHRRTMQVVDGRHRLVAAQARGDDRIRVHFVDGDDDASFLLAVHLNVRHGLPLSRRDRAAAVDRLLSAHPEWSDRRIALLVGVAHTTVGAARSRSTGGKHQSNGSLGRDGRVRPRDGSERRRRAAALLAERPDASTREIARSVGVSLGTVVDVRRRSAPGSDTTLPAQAPTDRPRRSVSHLDGTPADDAIRTLNALRSDPSLRYSTAGRTLLRLLFGTLGLRDLEQLAVNVPTHTRDAVARVCRESAREWLRVADALESRADAGTASPARAAARPGA